MSTPEPASGRPSLAGRVALVTGAAHRLGRALALALAGAGADVAVHCQSSRREAEAVVDRIRASGRRSTLVAVDLRDPEATERAFGQAAETLGGLDVLVNNVGSIVWKKLDEHTAEDWRTCIDGTLFVTLHATRAALPFMRRRRFGRVVNVLDADADAATPVPFASAYKIGKRATWLLTKSQAVDEARHGVTVNAVSPGTLEDSPVKPPLERMPSGRYGTYADVAEAVLFLASEAAGHVNGTQIKVSGAYLV